MSVEAKCFLSSRSERKSNCFFPRLLKWWSFFLYPKPQNIKTVKSLLCGRTKLACVVQNYDSLSLKKYFFQRVTCCAWSMEIDHKAAGVWPQLTVLLVKLSWSTIFGGFFCFLFYNTAWKVFLRARPTKQLCSEIWLCRERMKVLV